MLIIILIIIIVVVVVVVSKQRGRIVFFKGSLTFQGFVF